MFCQFCGKQISDNAVFCPKCGKPTAESTVNEVNTNVSQPKPPIDVSPPNTQSSEIYDAPLIKRQNYRSSAFGGQVFVVILFVVLFIIELTLVVSDPGPFSRWRKSDEDFMKTLLIIFLIGDIICAIIGAIKIIPIKNTFVCITEAGVYGSGGSPLYFATKPVCLSYPEITDVSVYSGGIIISNFGNTYKCAIENESFIAGLIRDKVQKYKSEKWTCSYCRTNNVGGTICTACQKTRVEQKTVFGSTSPSNHSWTCPKCGTINSSYTGTCGCGTRKP